MSEEETKTIKIHSNVEEMMPTLSLEINENILYDYKNELKIVSYRVIKEILKVHFKDPLVFKEKERMLRQHLESLNLC
jgi:GMP synthase PP-ATPase subunit